MKKTTNRTSLTARLTAMLLAALICLSLFGCGKEPAEVPDTDLPSASDVSESDVPPEIRFDAEPLHASLGSDGVILEDNDFLYFAINSIVIKTDGNTELNLTLRNKTNRQLRLYLTNAAVNGWMMNDSYGFLLEPEEELVKAVTINHNRGCSYYTAADCGITSVETFSFVLCAGLEEHYHGTRADREYCITTSVASGTDSAAVERRTTSYETTLINSDNLSIIVYDYDKYDFSEYVLEFDDGTSLILDASGFYCAYAYVENKTDEYLQLSWSCTAVNNLSVTSNNTTMIAPHCREYICFYFNLNDVVQNEIKKIDTMTCYIKLLTPNGSLEESGEYVFNPKH